ncbi:hypothetical protein N7478_013279 [Penicillium angulare]|uniref:uncharacterized protein n=1 Tax=Penicillium angulare TaxID=116970 RepID=UPI0025406F87|nr:uncharacterized protein N7478_013279 [Penicillium angulare]KAJ5257175.1 hypothetical protein N7478_013279 [Penicillium angulare]
MASAPRIISKSVLPNSTPPKPWFHHLNIDTILKVLYRTAFNPFLAWILVLCLRAQVTPPTHPAWIFSVSYAIIISLLFILGTISHRVAYGLPRNVEPEREVVLVTGGASGLGLLIAQIYGKRGVAVAVLDVKDIVEEEVEEVFGEGVDLRYFKCDVGDRKELEIAKKDICKELGTPTIVINCAAARINGKPLLELSPDDFEKTLRTNLTAAFHLYQAFLPGILGNAENGGTLVTVSSVLGQLGPAGLTDYSASKAGLSALHRTMEAELRGNENIKTLLVETGQMSTPLFNWIRNPSHFFSPVLEPVEVAKEIVATVDSGHGGVLRLPAFAKLINWYAVFPGALQVVARYLSGIDAVVSSSLQSREIPSNRAGRVLRSSKKRTD